MSGRRSFHIDEVDIGTASIVQEGDELEETSSRLERDTSVSQVVGIVGIDADDARLSGGESCCVTAVTSIDFTADALSRFQ